MFIQYQKKLENSIQIIKKYEDFIGDKKIKIDILDRNCGDKVAKNCSEKREVSKTNSVFRFIEVLENN